MNTWIHSLPDLEKDNKEKDTSLAKLEESMKQVQRQQARSQKEERRKEYMNANQQHDLFRFSLPARSITRTEFLQPISKGKWD